MALSLWWPFTWRSPIPVVASHLEVPQSPCPHGGPSPGGPQSPSLWCPLTWRSPIPHLQGVPSPGGPRGGSIPVVSPHLEVPPSPCAHGVPSPGGPTISLSPWWPHPRGVPSPGGPTISLSPWCPLTWRSHHLPVPVVAPHLEVPHPRGGPVPVVAPHLQTGPAAAAFGGGRRCHRGGSACPRGTTGLRVTRGWGGTGWRRVRPRRGHHGGTRGEAVVAGEMEEHHGRTRRDVMEEEEQRGHHGWTRRQIQGGQRGGEHHGEETSRPWRRSPVHREVENVMEGHRGISRLRRNWGGTHHRWTSREVRGGQRDGEHQRWAHRGHHGPMEDT